MAYFVYILYSPSKDQYYVGQTNDLSKRLARHNAGYERFTKSRKPWELEHSEGFETRAEAMIKERKLKNLKSQEKIKSYIDKKGVEGSSAEKQNL